MLFNQFHFLNDFIYSRFLPFISFSCFHIEWIIINIIVSYNDKKKIKNSFEYFYEVKCIFREKKNAL